MKRLFISLGCLLIAASFVFVSCNKDKKVPVTVNKYFEVVDATLVEKEFPAAKTDVNISVSMNGNVLAGGTSIVHVTSPVTASRILVGMPNEGGYYEISPVNVLSMTYDFTMIINQQIQLEEGEEGFNVQIAILDAEGRVSQIWTQEVALIAAGTGQLQVSLSFDNEKDVDLHLFEPNGTHVYYGHSWSENGGELDVDSNASCYIDGINNENIFYGGESYVEPGTYTVYVDLYENCDETIATNFVVSAFYEGQLIAAQTGHNPVSGTFPVGEPSNYNNLENLTPVMTFVIPDHGQQPVKKFAPKPLSEIAIEKMAIAAENR